MQMRNSFIRAVTIMAGFVIAYAASAAGQSTKRVTIPAGTRILIRTIDSLDSSKQKTGYRFTASLETNLQADDVLVAPRGSTVYGRLAEASSAGRMSGSSQLTLELTDIVINGTAYPLLTSTSEVKGKGEGKKTAGKVLGGTGLGALIGGIAGEDQELPLARSPVRRVEQRLPPLRKASSCRSRANPCSSSDLSNPRPYRLRGNDALDRKSNMKRFCIFSVVTLLLAAG